MNAEQSNYKLTYRQLVSDLQKDGLITTESADQLYSEEDIFLSLNMHPVNYFETKKFPDRRKQGRPLLAREVCGWIAYKAELPYFHIDPFFINIGAVIETISHKFAKKNMVLPVAVNAEEIVVACGEPFARDWLNEITAETNKKVKIVFSNPDDIVRSIHDFYSASNDAENSEEYEVLSDQKNISLDVIFNADFEKDNSGYQFKKIAKWLIEYAFTHNATAIHLEPRSYDGLVRFRIDGVLHTIREIPVDMIKELIKAMMALPDLYARDYNKSKERKFSVMSAGVGEISCTLSEIQVIHGHKVVISIVNEGGYKKKIEEQGLMGDNYAAWRNLINSSHGLLLVAGETLSEIKSTLYGSLNSLSRNQESVFCIESNISQVNESFVQVQISSDKSEFIRENRDVILNQDNDIVMIDVIDGLDVAKFAVDAVSRGILVIAGVYAVDSFSGLRQLENFGLNANQIADCCLGVLFHGRLRRMCGHCKMEDAINEDDWAELLKPWKMKHPRKTYTTCGCVECRDTGYLGQHSVYELFEITPNIKELLVSNAGVNLLQRQAIKNGMKNVRVAGAHLVTKGLTTIEEVEQFTSKIHI
jgi:general secretion pathway protein E